MPLQISKPPRAAEKAVHSMLGRLVAADPDLVPALRSASLRSLSISTPHRVAVLELDRIHDGSSLRSAAQKKGWRFLVHNGKDVVATINTFLGRNGKHQFGHITDGPFVAGTERAIRRAETLEPVQNGRFELLLLQAPAIHVVALWLRNLANGADLLVPISPAPNGLRPDHALSTSDFMAAAAKLASQVQSDHAEARRRHRS
jgi:hypothetical protein